MTNPEARPASVPVSDGSESARIAGLDAVNKIGYMVPAVVRNGVILCPECGDETVEVSRDGDWINYECRTGKALWDGIYRDLVAAFDAACGGLDDV